MQLYPVVHVDQRLRRERRDRFLDRTWDLADRFGGVYVVDRVGLERNKPNIDAYQELARDTSVWLDAGPVDVEDLMDTVIVGVERVTVRWDRVRSRETLWEMMEMIEDGFFVGVPFRDAALENRRSGAIEPGAVAQRLQRLDVGGFVLVDLVRAGTGDGFRTGHVTTPQRFDVPVWAAGGVSGPREARGLVEKGYAGVVVGTEIDGFSPEAWR